MKKTFDCVELQRKLRDDLAKKYLEDPDKFMQEINRKYPATGSKTDKDKPAS